MLLKASFGLIDVNIFIYPGITLLNIFRCFFKCCYIHSHTYCFCLSFFLCISVWYFSLLLFLQKCYHTASSSKSNSIEYIQQILNTANPEEKVRLTQLAATLWSVLIISILFWVILVNLWLLFCLSFDVLHSIRWCSIFFCSSQPHPPPFVFFLKKGAFWEHTWKDIVILCSMNFLITLLFSIHAHYRYEGSLTHSLSSSSPPSKPERPKDMQVFSQLLAFISGIVFLLPLYTFIHLSFFFQKMNKNETGFRAARYEAWERRWV